MPEIPEAVTQADAPPGNAGKCRDAEKYQRLIKAIEQVDDVIVITDTSGIILYVNPASERLTGFSVEEVIGQSWKIWACDKQGETFFDDIWLTLKLGQVWSGPMLSRRKDGSYYDEEVTISPLRDDDGNIVNFVSVKRDVTKQRSMEKQLSQAQKLESIGQLAAGIAHEINTPIQYVGDNTRFLKTAFDDLLGMITNMKVKIAGLPDELRGPCQKWFDELAEEVELDYLVEEVPEAVDQSLDGVQRVATIVRAMKEFSHPGGDEKAPVDLNSAIQNTVTVARNEWKYVADVELELDATLPPVLCRAGELNQVWLNLIVNASHAIDEKKKATGDHDKGKITISTGTEGNVAVVKISDTGAGIPDEILARIFDPFFTTKGVGKGTGQGLAIAHSVIVDKHNGKLEVKSKPGEGSVFTIRLPMYDEIEN